MPCISHDARVKEKKKKKIDDDERTHHIVERNYYQNKITGMRRLRGVIFDIDGTLTKPVYNFAVLRRRLQDSVVGRFQEGSDVLHELDVLSPRSRERAEQVICAFEEEGRERFAWNDGAVELLRYFHEKKTLRMAVVTRNSDVTLQMLEEQLEQNKLPKCFDIALSRKFTPPKPHPAPALYIAKEWGFEPNELLFVGDGQHDLECR
jgi:phosphoglycolate phosphatase-like HAD superfamily hydrolase